MRSISRSWDPSVKALTQFPSVLNDLAKNLSWTSSLGQAFVNQLSDVMAAVQAMRAKAQAAGTLQSSSQITVTQQSPSTIVIQPANPNVVYVPQYNPTVVYGSALCRACLHASRGRGNCCGFPSEPALPSERSWRWRLVGGGFVGGGFGWGFGAWGCNWGAAVAASASTTTPILIRPIINRTTTQLPTIQLTGAPNNPNGNHHGQPCGGCDRIGKPCMVRRQRHVSSRR